MILRFTIVLALFFFAVQVQSRTCISTGNGSWGVPTSWLCDGLPDVPTGGDDIIILQGHQITVTNANETVGGTNPVYLYIYGLLYFDNGSKITLPCNSGIGVYAPDGEIDGTGNGSSNRITICNTVVWSTDQGSVPPGSTLGDPPPPSPLPVELLSFEGKPGIGGNIVSWSTSSEINNSHFNVQRSIDGKKFTTITRIAGAGNSNKKLHYNYTDVQAPAGTVYYRLEQVDYDGSSTLSAIISVKLSKHSDEAPLVYPNPVSSQGPAINFRWHGLGDETATIMIYDMTGKEVKRIVSTGGRNEISAGMSESALPPGRYIVRFSNATETRQVPLIVIR